MSYLDDFNEDMVDSSDKTEIPTTRYYIIEIGVKSPFDETEIAKLKACLDDATFIPYFENGKYSFPFQCEIGEHPFYRIIEGNNNTLPLEMAEKILWIAAKKANLNAVTVIYPNPMVIEVIRKENKQNGRDHSVYLPLLFGTYNLALINMEFLGYMPRSVAFHKFIASLFSFNFEYHSKKTYKNGLFGGEGIRVNEWNNQLQNAIHSSDFTLWEIDVNKEAQKVEDIDESIKKSFESYNANDIISNSCRFQIIESNSKEIRSIYLRIVWINTDDEIPDVCKAYAFMV